MLDNVSELHDSASSRAPLHATPLWTLAICGVWILSGLVGRDPWKPDEAYTFGLVYEILKHGDWVVPTLAGEPFLEKPPLFFVTAAVFAKAFGTILPLHDAARLASGFYVAVTLAFVALTERELNGRRSGCAAVLILIGCLGLVVEAHMLITDLAQLAGISMGIYGFALGRRSTGAAGLWIGIGAATSFLAKGLLGPGILGLCALLLTAFPAWRRRAYLRALAVAALVAIPPIAGWSAALFLRSPAHFHTWLVTNNLGRFFGFVSIGPQVERLSYPTMLLWYAFPALPLAAWTIWQAVKVRGTWADPALQLPALVTAAIMIVLGFAHDARALYLMPALVPLALLAAARIESVPTNVVELSAAASHWLGGIMALLLWLGWQAMFTGKPAVVADWLRDYQPGFIPEFQVVPASLALALTLLWIWAMRRRADGVLRGPIAWAAGVTLAWALIATLWLPYLDAGKSYRAMIASLAQSLPHDGCVRSRFLGEPQRAMLDYYANTVTFRDEAKPNRSCDTLLIQGWSATGAPASEPGWVAVWEGARPGDHSELYRLYVRGHATSAPPRRFPR